MKISINNKLIHPDAIFLDLDGTTLDLKKHGISKENIQAIREASKNSLIVISTGRSYNKKVKELMLLLDLKYAICQNGAYIIDIENNEKKILDIYIEKEEVEEIWKFAKKNNLVMLVNSEYKLYSRRKILFLARLFNKTKYKKYSDFNFGQKIHKIVLAGPFRKKIFKYYNEIKEEIPNLSYSISGRDYIIEITHEDASKGIAADFLCNLLNLDASKSIHIGDSLNDSSTLSFLGALIAMGNASKHLKKIATHIGVKNKKGGLSKVLNGAFTKNDYNL
ncbi:MAG: Cof-type HAD-IIB family hydrolase [Metamycoplasmataceae bacterium]